MLKTAGKYAVFRCLPFWQGAYVRAACPPMVLFFLLLCVISLHLPHLVTVRTVAFAPVTRAVIATVGIYGFRPSVCLAALLAVFYCLLESHTI